MRELALHGGMFHLTFRKSVKNHRMTERYCPFMVKAIDVERFSCCPRGGAGALMQLRILLSVKSPSQSFWNCR